jgi:hypothetical protein
VKHKAIIAALVAATLQTTHASAATALEYKVHATLPHGENISATVSMEGRRPEVQGASGRDVGPVMDAVNTATTIARAAASGKRSVQVAIGPGHNCIDVSISLNGNTVTATGTMDAPPPPPRDEQQGQRNDGPPPPPRDHAKLTIRIVETLENQQLIAARGNIAPEDNRGPHFEWTLEKVGQ